jgi:hypothetical protein
MASDAAIDARIRASVVHRDPKSVVTSDARIRIGCRDSPGNSVLARVDEMPTL